MNPKLSKRQVQILKMILAGYTQQEICEILDLHTNSVSGYKRIIMDKWGVENMIELVVESIKRGYLEMDEKRFDKTHATHTPHPPKTRYLNH
jgi:DNA-binding NarL/FixJ family response regulator